jgi:hypothetical protein
MEHIPTATVRRGQGKRRKDACAAVLRLGVLRVPEVRPVRDHPMDTVLKDENTTDNVLDATQSPP